MERDIIKESIENLKHHGYRIILSGVKYDKQIILYKDGKAIVLYKGYYDRGQKWNSQIGSFKLAEKMNESYKKKDLMCQVTPALMRSFIIDAAEEKKVKKTF